MAYWSLSKLFRICANYTQTRKVITVMIGGNILSLFNMEANTIDIKDQAGD